MAQHFLLSAQARTLSLRSIYQDGEEAAYANEAAWKEDYRRLSNGALASRTVALAMVSPKSPVWAGYWQRNAV